MDEILFYSGNGNHSLGAGMISHLEEYFGRDFHFENIDFGLFPDGESDNRIPRFTEISGKTVIFYQSIYNENLLEEALELIWAIKRQYKALHLIAVIPFLIFRRQDHEEKNDEICRLKMIIDRLKHAGVDEMITVSPHSADIDKFCQMFDVKLWEIDPSPLFASTIKTYISDKPTIYSPDRGSITRAIKLAKLTGGRVIFSLKERGLNNEANIKPEEKEEVDRLISYYQEKEDFLDINYADAGHIVDESIVMVEDEISTGTTANKTGRRLKGLGARKIIFLAVHPVLVHGWRRKLFDRNPFDKIILGDTIPRGYEKRTGGLIHDISVAELMAQTLYKALGRFEDLP